MVSAKLENMLGIPVAVDATEEEGVQVHVVEGLVDLVKVGLQTVG